MPHDELHHIRRARAGLSQIIEPGDAYAGTVLRHWGPARTLAIICGEDHPTGEEWQQLGPRTESFRNAMSRWRGRRGYLHPERALKNIRRLQGGFIIPEDLAWPAALDDLEDQRAIGLWWRGSCDLPNMAQMVSVVGSREVTNYGQQVTHGFVGHLVRSGFSVLSGGAYGIDAHAHAAALAVAEGGSPPTVAVLAGGLDQFYPAGNTRMLESVIERGAMISELPPGFRPNRYRFLHRNRIIAALSATTLVVEARWRSGAQSTAHHALGLGREVGVVPGPIDAASSAGCHRLLRDTPSSIVFDKETLTELTGPGPGPVIGPGTEATAASITTADRRAVDELNQEELLVYEALPVRSGTNVDRLCGITGLPAPSVIRVLTALQVGRQVEQLDSGWRKTSR